ncbi:hypothetical protein PRIPAC_76666, partial [Pristionchus pacificus]|uniref:Uncharacterized protein n=1 Tax=Pristionchus pacificus TaxID=54126 RepID=A0A2A6BZL0_PRIPA
KYHNQSTLKPMASDTVAEPPARSCHQPQPAKCSSKPESNDEPDQFHSSATLWFFSTKINYVTDFIIQVLPKEIRYNPIFLSRDSITFLLDLSDRMNTLNLNVQGLFIILRRTSHFTCYVLSAKYGIHSEFCDTNLHVSKLIFCDTYETVCERVGQELAHLKNLDSLKICFLGFSRVLMTMGILIFHIDVPLAPDGVTSKTVFPEFLTVISIEFYLGSQTRLIFAFILTEEFWRNCFRRHAVWSQRNVDMKNEYPHRHQHPREP